MKGMDLIQWLDLCAQLATFRDDAFCVPVSGKLAGKPIRNCWVAYRNAFGFIPDARQVKRFNQHVTIHWPG